MQKRRTLSIIFFTIAITSIIAQNKPVLYGFAELPQTLLLNPGAETNYRFHVGVPLISGFSSTIASSKVKMEDLFLKDNVDFNIKFSKILNKLDKNDNLSFNTQIEVLSGGYRLNNKTYISAGFYEEIDFMGYFPKDIVTLLYKGNAAYLNKSFSLSQLIFNIDVLGVLHAGITRVFNKKLTLGGRLKIYSSSMNINSTNNFGTITTVLGDNNIYKHYLHNLNVSIKSSGIISKNKKIDKKNLISDTFFGGSLGIGLDVGFTYHLTNQVEVTGSILDVGFINHKKNNFSHTVKGSYIFDGIPLKYDPLHPSDYWSKLDKEFKSKVDSKSNTDSYFTWRPTKINTSLKYSFGKARLNKECYGKSYREYYNSAVGVQLYTIFRPLRPQIAFTGFYERVITEKLFAKITYTIDKYSLTNVGAGFSFQVGKINFYGMIGNLFKLQNLNTANNVSLQFGFNLIFN